VACSFAEMLATAQGDGFFETDRAGIISTISMRTAELYERSSKTLLGRPVLGLVALKETAKLRAFLEEPARFAGTERPFVRLAGASENLEVLMFAEGMAGIVTGYFGLVHTTKSPSSTQSSASGISDSSLLERIGRGIRRPLNTIMGFSELIQSGSFGVTEIGKYVEYASDINASGHEISAMVDELEQFSQLRSGEFNANPVDVDLGVLLDHVEARIRTYATRARVLVRSAISHELPKISADSATLEQALLNLLASAIDQTPPGAQVVLSAHQSQDGSVEIHVRDSSVATLEGFEERFVVFRDGTNLEGDSLQPIRSTMGLALTRTLLAVNACSLTVDPTAGVGTLMSLTIPTDLVIRPLI
jgi:signal transduction histidine kinase